ncbi:MAG TPA: AraC family transcriptional regulator [Dongiaceae bacterium]|nr:AraC family transcriptional regulator [Dongiaceae bacterium]
MPQLSLRSYGTEIACHAHNFNQIVLPRRGRLAMEIAGRGGAVSTEHGAFISAGMMHQYQAGAGDQFFVLDLVAADGAADEIEMDELAASPFFDLTPAQHDLLSYLDRLAVGEADVPRLEHAPGADSRWQRLGASWGFLMLDSLAMARSRALAAPVPPAGLRRALDLMRSHYGDKLSIAAIARAAGLSETRLFLLCRQHLGMTPHAYLNDLRLQAAERLLRGSILPIAEIALRCGQVDQAALTRLMQRRRGVTPAAYRRMHRG